ncbi:hypothetical protein CPC08DRAFT_707680 [Agrocybe pediades]|nr:hypothetical protein CPC08DRAFT_707680 [Agrocybe pediades]
MGDGIQSIGEPPECDEAPEEDAVAEDLPAEPAIINLTSEPDDEAVASEQEVANLLDVMREVQYEVDQCSRDVNAAIQLAISISADVQSCQRRLTMERARTRRYLDAFQFWTRVDMSMEFDAVFPVNDDDAEIVVRRTHGENPREDVLEEMDDADLEAKEDPWLAEFLEERPHLVKEKEEKEEKTSPPAERVDTERMRPRQNWEPLSYVAGSSRYPGAPYAHIPARVQPDMARSPLIRPKLDPINENPGHPDLKPSLVRLPSPDSWDLLYPIPESPHDRYSESLGASDTKYPVRRNYPEETFVELEAEEGGKGNGGVEDDRHVNAAEHGDEEYEEAEGEEDPNLVYFGFSYPSSKKEKYAHEDKFESARPPTEKMPYTIYPSRSLKDVAYPPSRRVRRDVGQVRLQADFLEAITDYDDPQLYETPRAWPSRRRFSQPYTRSTLNGERSCREGPTHRDLPRLVIPTFGEASSSHHGPDVPVDPQRPNLEGPDNTDSTLNEEARRRVVHRAIRSPVPAPRDPRLHPQAGYYDPYRAPRPGSDPIHPHLHYDYANSHHLQVAAAPAFKATRDPRFRSRPQPRPQEELRAGHAPVERTCDPRPRPRYLSTVAPPQENPAERTRDPRPRPRYLSNVAPPQPVPTPAPVNAEAGPSSSRSVNGYGYDHGYDYGRSDDDYHHHYEQAYAHHAHGYDHVYAQGTPYYPTVAEPWSSSRIDNEYNHEYARARASGTSYYPPGVVAPVEAQAQAGPSSGVPDGYGIQYYAAAASSQGQGEHGHAAEQGDNVCLRFNSTEERQRWVRETVRFLNERHRMEDEEREVLRRGTEEEEIRGRIEEVEEEEEEQEEEVVVEVEEMEEEEEMEMEGEEMELEVVDEEGNEMKNEMGRKRKRDDEDEGGEGEGEKRKRRRQ